MQFQIYFVSIKNFSLFTIQVNLNRIETSLNNKVIDMSKSTMYQQIGEGKKRRTQPKDKEKTEEWFEGKTQPRKEEERREKKYGELIKQDL